VSASSSRKKGLARKLASPVTAPIDGRVGDINRRVETVRVDTAEVRQRLDQLAAAVGDYATASTESTSFVGVELRRLEATLRELHARSVNEHYRAKLAAAIERPLADLDGDLATVINFAGGHRGFAAQGELWFNPPVTVELSEGRARLAGVNERIVELPFAMAALGRLTPPARVLDIGSAESWFPLAAASLGHHVTALDLRPLPYTHPNLTSSAGRFEDWEAPAEPFDAAFVISTVEHVGLGAYGESAYGEHAPGEGADREFLQRIRAVLSDDGFLALTTPYGRRAVSDFERVYDADALAALMEGWNIVERREVFRRDDVTWTADADAGERTQGVVLVVATPA
jgi:2-polyprenyl-3-methyl-5-hydroxy-6-metoxy-1,4-benzoquinol methylase